MTEALVHTRHGGMRDVGERLASSVVTGGGLVSPREFDGWWDERRDAVRFRTRRVALEEMAGWRIEPESGSLVHESGRFFRVEGVLVEGPAGWTRPIINQPEIGVLGILMKEFGGVLHCLMQAKVEPGNLNGLQLSPTVQATRSNFTRVHQGSGTRYLEYFRGPTRGRVLVDVLQSEQGGWFWRKQNRNMVVLAEDDVPAHEDFRWLTLGQVLGLLRRDDFVNMDARSVLACLPLAAPVGLPDAAFTRALMRSYEPGQEGLWSLDEVLSWLTEAKTRCEWTVRLVGLNQVSGWARSDMEIADAEGRDFRVIGVDVDVTHREVSRWCQPLLAPRGEGLAVFFTRTVDGVLHVLVQARQEPGLRDLVEVAPTVQIEPRVDGIADRAREPFVTHALAADPARVRFDSTMSEEGGRFHHARTRYQIIETGADFPVTVPPNYCWVTVRQLVELVRHGHYLNVEARSLLACVHSLW